MPPFGELMFGATMSFIDLASIEKTEKSSAKPSTCQVEAIGIEAQLPATPFIADSVNLARGRNFILPSYHTAVRKQNVSNSYLRDVSISSLDYLVQLVSSQPRLRRALNMTLAVNRGSAILPRTSRSRKSKCECRPSFPL